MNKTVAVTYAGGKKIEARIDGMTVRTDQSADKGGEGTAPNPFQLFLAALAACAGYYAMDFCQSRELSSEGMSVKMDCEFDAEDKLYKKMNIELTLPKDFPPKYQEAIVRAVNNCTVKKHIINAPIFKITTV
jgi:putative redox protein